MNYENKMTRDDAIFYLDMIGSSRSPNQKHKIGELKPYYKILGERNSDDFRRFIRIYTEMKHLLTDKEQFILNEIYGVNKEREKLKTIGKMLNVGPERIRQIGTKAEYKIARIISEKLKDSTIENC
ncbi:sigma factor-like helix-turn-helix DNA-binding protein [Neobacillus sp. WH10]|uniref:sigma factor-like helix-turn-helix DNA-binding protein n=1 Tax=Neobacillus sp. WH10 TaxID=3047873 RepID=UPI0024C1C8F3|nr:sigma factor-like helix-turn-helix DNA-binding protein [Neobacillus sp. WH10]WHY75697.1 sigma factor-like helix-turn-helix DNA-binding protein [Neobacillus sp. WH10]